MNLTDDQLATLRATAEGVLAAHQMVSTTSDACSCNWGSLDVPLATGAAIRGHRAHIATEIVAALTADPTVSPEPVGEMWPHMDGLPRMGGES